GVRSVACPADDRHSPRHWSQVIRRTFGFLPFRAISLPPFYAFGAEFSLRGKRTSLPTQDRFRAIASRIERSIVHCLHGENGPFSGPALSILPLLHDIVHKQRDTMCPNGRSHAMLDQIKGLHHVTSMASDARRNNHFFTKTLG